MTIFLEVFITLPTPKNKMSHTYKLSYFAGRGRAEVSRLILAEAGVEWEDDRVTDWPGTLKASMYRF